MNKINDPNSTSSRYADFITKLATSNQKKLQGSSQPLSKKDQVVKEANNAIQQLLELNADEEAKLAKDKLDQINKIEQQKRIKELENTKQELLRNATQAIDGLIALKAQKLVSQDTKKTVEVPVQNNFNKSVVAIEASTVPQQTVKKAVDQISDKIAEQQI